jgi:serine/threonine protein kinase
MKKSTKRVSHYVLREELGHGSFGTVFRGEDSQTNDIRAIKMIPNTKLIDARQKTALKQEIEIMKDLNHENILKLFDHIVSSRYNYLVLEYCSGGELGQFITAGRGIGEERAKIYLRQIISALKVLHQKGIVHRDLKPANILLTADDKIKLADFGFARRIDPESLAKSCVGTPVYMAPEVFIVRDHRDERYDYGVDIWSVGCIVYELITGERPFDMPSFDQLIPTITRKLETYDFLSPLSDICKDFLKKIFTLDPQHRIRFNEFCDHPFVNGVPSIRSIAGLIDGPEDRRPDDLTKAEAIAFSEIVIQNQKTIDYPFILHMKACMLLIPYLKNDDNCAHQFVDSYEEACRLKNQSDWESKSLTQVVLETVMKMCLPGRISPRFMKETYSQALILLKALKPSSTVIKLKEAINRQMTE